MAAAVTDLEARIQARKTMFKNNAASFASMRESVSQQPIKLQYDELLKKHHAADRGNSNDHETLYRGDYSKYLAIEKTRLFSLIGKRKSEQAYQALAHRIVLAALPPDKKVSADAGAEIVYLLLHLVHRQAFEQLGAPQRDTVLDEVSRLALTGYTNAVLGENAQQDALIQNARQMMSTLKSRQSIYAQCESIFGEKFPDNGTMVFALSFFVYRAMGYTDRNDVDEILTGKRDISDSELEDFPKPPEIMATASAMELIVDELQTPRDLTFAEFSKNLTVSRNLSSFFGWVAVAAAIVVLVWWTKSAGTTDDSSVIVVLETDETMHTRQSPGSQSKIYEVKQPGDTSAHPNDSVKGLAGLITHPESMEMRIRGIAASISNAEYIFASSTSPEQTVISGATKGLEPLPPPVIAGHTHRAAHVSITPGAVANKQPTVGVDKDGPWAINLVSSLSKADAERLAEKARSRDIQTQQQQVTVKGKQYWRVQITGFSTMEEARTYVDTAKEKLGLKEVWIMKR